MHWLIAAILALLAFHTLFVARALLLPIAFAMLVAIVLAPTVRHLRRRGVREPFGAGLVVLALFAVAALIITALVEPAARWLDRLPRDLHKIGAVLGDLRRVLEDLALTRSSSAIASSLGSEPVGDRLASEGMALMRAALLNMPGAAISVASTFILLYFFLASGRRMFLGCVGLLPSASAKHKLLRVARELRRAIGHFFVTTSVINVGLGVATAAALAWLGVPNALLWGTVVALLNFVPYLGPATCTLLLAFVGAVSFDRLVDQLAVPLAYLALAAIESNLLSPWVVGRRLAVNPLAIFLSVLMWGWLWGIVGTLMGVPFVLALKIAYPTFTQRRTGGEAPSEPGARLQPERGPRALRELHEKRSANSRS